MLIDEYELPSDILEHLINIIDIVPDRDIIEYVINNKALQKGYQINKKNAKVFRKRIKKHLTTVKTLDSEILGILGEYSLSGSLLIYLSLPIIKLEYKNIINAFDFYDVMVALLLDMRKELRQLAVETLHNHEEEPFEQPEPDVVAMGMCSFLETLDPLYEQLDTFRSVYYQDDEADDSVQEDYSDNIIEFKRIGQMEAQIAKLTAELKEAKEHEKKERKLSRALKEKNEKLQRAEKELQNTKNNLKKLNIDLNKLRKDLDKKQAEFESGIKAGVEKELKLHIRDWMIRPVELQKYVDSSVGVNNDLLLIAGKALKKQAQKDKHFGNLRTLREQLEKFIDAHKDIVRARSEALSPVSELVDIESKLNKKISEIRKHLGSESDIQLSEVAIDIQSAINTAITMQELSVLFDKLTELGEMGILSDNELRSLYSVYHNKQERMYDLLLLDSPGIDVPVSSAWQFKSAIDKKEPFTWILDGHNVLFSLIDIFGCDESGVPGEDARGKLISAIKVLVKDAPQCGVNIFFDGPVYSQEHAAPNIKITYSGGEGDHRADNAILEMAEYMHQNSPGEIRVLVTDDRDLARQANKYKVASMRLAEFAAIIVDCK